jgi:hypothetical protein
MRKKGTLSFLTRLRLLGAVSGVAYKNKAAITRYQPYKLRGYADRLVGLAGSRSALGLPFQMNWPSCERLCSQRRRRGRLAFSPLPWRARGPLEVGLACQATLLLGDEPDVQPTNG